MSLRTRNETVPQAKEDSYICNGLDEADVEFLTDGIAGATCEGGTFDQQDLNDGVTESDCVDFGGVYKLYSCEDMENIIKLLERRNWRQWA
jgi:hypothetical protein